MSRSINDKGRRRRTNRKAGPSCGCWYCDEGRVKRYILRERELRRELAEARR